MPEVPMKRLAIFVYGIASYAVFFATFLYAIAFIGDLPGIPRSIDGEPLLPSGQALAIDLLLLTLFAVQHSVMTRPTFKRSEEHTSELQSRENLVCRLLLEK